MEEGILIKYGGGMVVVAGWDIRSSDMIFTCIDFEMTLKLAP